MLSKGIVLVLLAAILVPMNSLAVGGGHENLMHRQREALQDQLQKQTQTSARANPKRASRYTKTGKKYLARARAAEDEKSASKDYKRAVEKFERALQLDPEQLDAQLALAEIYLATNEAQKALEASARSLKITGGNPLGLRYRGEALTRLHHFNDARYVHEILLDLDHPSHAEQLVTAMRTWRHAEKDNSSVTEHPEFEDFSDWLNQASAPVNSNQ